MKCNPTVKFGFLLLFLGIFMGCATGFTDLRGADTNPKHRIPLKKDGPHEGVFKTEDLTLTYKYTLDASGLRISGNLELASRLRSFEHLDYFFSHVYFLDATGKVLDRKELVTASSLDGSGMKRIPVDKRYPLPQGAEEMAFGYDGRVEEASGGTATSWDFWMSPRR